jgi:hypothetical protein
VVITAALVVPSVALADSCGGNPTTSIYNECVPKANGTHHTHTNKKPVTSSQPSTGSTTPWVEPQVTPVHVSKKAKHVIAHAGKDKKTLKNIVSNPDLVDAQHLKPVLASAPTKESSLGSAFDLGSGPLLLFALLAGTVLVLLGTGGVRSWRNRHRV